MIEFDYNTVNPTEEELKDAWDWQESKRQVAQAERAMKDATPARLRTLDAIAEAAGHDAFDKEAAMQVKYGEARALELVRYVNVTWAAMLDAYRAGKA